MILEEILANKRAEVAEKKWRVPLAVIRERALGSPGQPDLAAVLKREHIALIAEIKRASPSRGILRSQVSPSEQARVYAENGAAAISVLTDEMFFKACPADLPEVRAATAAPILRKDFVVDEYQIYESRVLGASAILLIVRALSRAQLGDYLKLAHALGLTALVEVHDEEELECALEGEARLIGINNRNLADFTVDLSTTERLAPLLPRDRVCVAESGILTAADVERVASAGAHAVLVGEALMRADDPGAQVRELAGVRRVR